ncbi:hypothetical protein U879_12550 [Defluviimonas sp. 20V17]|nr:hypothetical protein U879_12550 [Defluviimonas sp. 20V17]
MDLAALVGSRICHDLVSPLGAVANGLELLAMAEGATGPELALIEESVASAKARVRFFRIAFGQAGADARLSRAEIVAILDDLTRGGRVTVDWSAVGDVSRPEAKLGFLIVLCCESALAFGGRIVIGCEGGVWTARASHEKLRIEAPLWDWLGGTATGADSVADKITPAQAQFALARAQAGAQGCRISVQRTGQEIVIAW